MRVKISLFVLLCVAPLCISAQGLEDIIVTLDSASCNHVRASFSLYSPSAQEPVAYTLDLLSKPTPADSLSPCSYIIGSRSSSPSHTSEGFSAYFNGEHYRYANNRLHEYHYSTSPEAFAPGGNPRMGVQQQAQFVFLLPQMLAGQLREIASDSTYTYNIKSSGAGIVIEGEQNLGGNASKRFSYIFDPTTLLPLKSTVTYNPDAISEQTVVCDWEYPSAQAPGNNSAENSQSDFSALLKARYPQAFRSVSAESLPGQPLPSFSAPVAGAGKRFFHESGETFPHPAVFVFLDFKPGDKPMTVNQIREAVARCAQPVELFWVSPTTNRVDEIQEFLGALPGNETALSSARSVAAACGVSKFPTVIIVGADGIVKDVVSENKGLSEFVIKKIE